MGGSNGHSTSPGGAGGKGIEGGIAGGNGASGGGLGGGVGASNVWRVETTLDTERRAAPRPRDAAIVGWLVITETALAAAAAVGRTMEADTTIEPAATEIATYAASMPKARASELRKEFWSKELASMLMLKVAETT